MVVIRSNRTSDVDGVGYSSYWFGGGFQPTDEDFALGFYNFWQEAGLAVFRKDMVCQFFTR